MELIITPECLSREELTHELLARGTKVTDADGVDKLVHNLKYYLALESSGVLFETGPRLDPKYEMKRCSKILTEIQELLARVLDEANNSTIATKIAHLRKRLSRFAAEPGPQEAKGELTADLNRAIDSFTTRVNCEVPCGNPRAVHAFGTTRVWRDFFPATNRASGRTNLVQELP
jgi:hypothetical protein